MFKFTKFAIIGSVWVAVASAGQIQIGGVNGLTNAYITSGCSGPGSCIAGSTGAYTEQNYDNVLFAGATASSVAPTPYASYSTTAANAGTITDTVNGVTFSMINDGLTAGASNNFWAAAQSGCSAACTSPTITIPIGIFGVTDVWTMLNTELGPQGAKNGTFIFTFGSTANATAGTSAITVKLFESSASNTAAGELKNAVDCSPATSCSTLASGPTLAGPVTNLTTGVSVYTNNSLLNPQISVTTYDNGPLGSYSTTSGNLVLSDQGFFFNNFALTGSLAGHTNLDEYLVSVKVQQSGVVNGVSDALSAITVNTAAVPEPSTVLLFLTGLAVIGFSQLRRRA